MKRISGNIILIYVLTFFIILTFATSCSKSANAVLNKGETEESKNTVLGEPVTYDELDLEPIYDEYSAITLDFDEKNVPDGAELVINEDAENVNIKAGGIYVLKGTLKGKRVKVTKGLGERIELVLNGFKYDGELDCPIYSPEEKNRVLIFLADGSENVINLNRNGKKDSVDDEAAIFANGDLSFNGKGKLTINTESESCIESKKNLTFIEGHYILNSKGDAIKAKEKLLMKDGNFNITSDDDAIKVTSENKGYFHFENANLYIVSNDKGISSDNEVHIIGGNINIDSNGESIRGKTVDISGGVVKLKSGEDGINADDDNQDKKENQKGVYVKVSGGELDIDATNDGIDSNGDLYLDGGKIYIHGSINDDERIIDYNGSVLLNGGVTFIGIGPASKMQDFGEKPNQNYIVLYYPSANDVGTNIEVKDDKGDIVLSHEITKRFNAALITSPKLVTGNTYTVLVGGKEFAVTIKSGRNIIK